jgi:hypothetical protein
MGDAAQVPTQWVLDSAAAMTELKQRASKRRGNLSGFLDINGPYRNFVELHLTAVYGLAGIHVYWRSRSNGRNSVMKMAAHKRQRDRKRKYNDEMAKGYSA